MSICCSYGIFVGWGGCRSVSNLRSFFCKQFLCFISFILLFSCKRTEFWGQDKRIVKLPVESHNPFHSNEKSGPNECCHLLFLQYSCLFGSIIGYLFILHLIYQLDSSRFCRKWFLGPSDFLIECKGCTVAFLMFSNLLSIYLPKKKLNGQTFFFLQDKENF